MMVDLPGQGIATRSLVQGNENAGMFPALVAALACVFARAIDGRPTALHNIAATDIAEDESDG
jgi:hypothetical protein